jgi:hypothetical protein
MRKVVCPKGSLSRVSYLFFLELWDLHEEGKKMHETPMRKAIKGVVQGAVRYVEFTRSYAAGELTVGVMPSVRWKKGKVTTNGETRNKDVPYEVKCVVKEYVCQRLTCNCPMG